MYVFMNQIPPQPIDPDPNEQRRREHQALRYRMLTGNWLQDLLDEISKHIPESRQAAWGVPDMSSNIFKASTEALCGLYVESPSVAVDETPGQTEGLLGRNGYITKAALWALMQRVQYFTIGMRECFLRISVDKENQCLNYRIVTCDKITAQSSDADPSKPIEINETRLRQDPETKKYEWTIDHLSIADPNNPVYEIYSLKEDGKIKENVSKKYWSESFSGTNYPYIDSQGNPYLPYTLYHAEIHGNLFDPFANREVIMGSLTCGVYFSFLGHLLKNCSFPQRYLLGAGVAGMDMYDNNLASRRNAIATDPSSILVFTADPDLQPGQQPQIGQYQPGGDVEKMLQSITTFERRLAAQMGIPGSDIQKMTGDPRSGFAIAVSRSSLREKQRHFSLSFRKSDIETIEISAKLANRYLGGSFPEMGYRIKYHAIPLSPQEQKEQRDNIIALLSQGLISKVDAVKMLQPDLDDIEAKKHLLKVQSENLEY